MLGRGGTIEAAAGTEADDANVELIEAEACYCYQKARNWDPSNIIHAVTLERVAAKHTEMRIRITARVKAELARQQKEENAHKKTRLGARCRKVHGPVVAPLLLVKRDREGPGR